MINLSTVVAAMQKELGSFVSTEAHPDMYRYINSAINYIYNRRDWQWNRPIYVLSYFTPGVEVQMEIFPQKIYRVKASGSEYDIFTAEDWMMNDSHDRAVGIFGNKFISDTSGVYQILYQKPAPSVGASDTEIDLPPFFIDALQAIAIHYAYKDIKDYQTANALIGQANAILDSVTERTVNTRPRQVTRLGSNYSF